MKTLALLALCLLASAGSLVARAAADDLPDVQPLLSGFLIISGTQVTKDEVDEGCAQAQKRRRLLRFDQFTWNNGPADLVLGDPQCPDCSTHPNVICGNPLFRCSNAPGHDHPHLIGFASYTVRRRGEPSVVARGHKEGWCLEDERCNVGVTPHNPDDTPQTVCNYLTAGCADVYPSNIGCQYVDITGLSPGNYVLDVALNNGRIFQESDYSNNTSRAAFEICNLSRQITVSANPAAQGSSDRTVSVKATVPLQHTINPSTSTVHIAASADGNPLIDLEIPSDGQNPACASVDTWTKVARNTWRYVNTSGVTGAGCTASSQGVQSVTLTLSNGGHSATLNIAAQIPVSVFSPVPHTFIARLQLANEGVNNDTCNSAQALKCRTNSSQVITCS